MDQNTQFIITVGTVIGVFLWLKHDIHQLNTKFDKLNDNYARCGKVSAGYAAA